MNKFNASFWGEKYESNTTGWDLGKASTPIKEYIEQLEDKSISILIPGCGNGYEAEFLHNSGFTNVNVLDITKQPLENFSQRVSSFPTKNLIHGDFFKHKSQYDLILEQTFFCALDPKFRPSYAEKMHELLKDSGKLTGLLFDFPLTEEGPPFGGCINEYIAVFSKRFHIKTMEASHNSIESRNGKELFVIFEKK